MNNKLIYSLIIAFLWVATTVQAQTSIEKTRVSDLPVIYMEKGINVHIISPEPIQFVDLSTDDLMGDLPADNIVRLKISDVPENETLYTRNYEVGIITIVGKSFIAQYRAIYQNNCKNCIASNKQIQPEEMQPLEYLKLKYSDFELKKIASDIFKKSPNKKKPIRKKNNLKLTMKLNNIYVMDDYIFLDISIENASNLLYDIEGIKFSIEDKKIYKATNNQSILLNPLFTLNDQKKFKKSYRNIFAFEKFTFPNSKILLIRLIEEQISGRAIEMKVNYSDVLEADTI
ncbi:MAG: conjugative transposon protein TraN [Capnocytophaga sp.]|nr:conjugative transposon protein TraN [Capnocytophaga sp.]